MMKIEEGNQSNSGSIPRITLGQICDSKNYLVIFLFFGEITKKLIVAIEFILGEVIVISYLIIIFFADFLKTTLQEKHNQK